MVPEAARRLDVRTRIRWRRGGQRSVLGTAQDVAALGEDLQVVLEGRELARPETLERDAVGPVAA